ncbi:hypothetical protein TNCT_167791 [Trichonephila clavata]|uniref:Uncharacterized protein n=1 Tax=Trichonephila clavata TaxID=2740835 RepID=A0A8X6HC99_TRICU|nr:hypothetical protein TNCT_167791 [Trichonephila clavata]
MLNHMGIKIGPEAHAFIVKCDNRRIEGSEIRASDASKQAKTACLEERISEYEFFEVEEEPMREARITHLKSKSINYHCMA